MTPAESVPLRHRVEYGAYRLLRGILVLLPLPIALGVGDVLGWLAGVVFRVRRGVVDENLARAFPQASPAWRRRVAVASYRHLGRESVMTLRVSGASAERIRALSDTVGFEELRAAVAEGNGAVMVTGHLGNWEVGSLCLAAYGVPFDAVMHRQRNRRFDEDLRATRGGQGVGIILRDSAPREVLGALRRGRVVGLVADQNVARSGIFVDFFGVPAATARGPAVFALRTGAPIWVGSTVRTGLTSPRYRTAVHPLQVDLVEDPDENVLRVTRALNRALEDLIRRHPEQYFWHHKRWKTRPPEARVPAEGQGG